MATALAVALFAPPAALAQEALMFDGNVRWEYNSFGGTGAVVSLEVPIGLNHAFQGWWWYRLAGDTRETMFPPPDLQTWGGNLLSLHWVDVDGRGFEAVLTGVIEDVGGAAHVRLTLEIFNNTSRTLEIDLFSYLDLDMGGTFNDDTANMHLSDNLILLFDQGAGHVGSFPGPRADRFEIDQFPGLLNKLNNGTTNNLCNCCNGSCFNWPTADFTGAFQWSNRVIPSGCSDRFMTPITINQGFDACGNGGCCFDNGSGGCDALGCCFIVGSCDPFCLSSWDSACGGTGFNGNGCGAKVLCDDCRGPICWEASECTDGNECTVDCCDPDAGGADGGGCLHTFRSRPYGDVTPFGSTVPPCNGADKANMGDGFANMLDVFCAFNAFNEGFPFTECPCADVAPCGGDIFVNMQDVFAIFSAFNDSPACPAPCP